MPDTPNGNDEDDEKKRTIKLFGHEFPKKKAVMAGLGGLLALALAGGGIAYAVSQQSEPDAKFAVEQESLDEQTEQAQKDDKGNTSNKEADVPLTDEEESKKAEEADNDSTGDKTATKPANGNPAASGGASLPER